MPRPGEREREREIVQRPRGERERTISPQPRPDCAGGRGEAGRPARRLVERKRPGFRRIPPEGRGPALPSAVFWPGRRPEPNRHPTAPPPAGRASAAGRGRPSTAIRRHPETRHPGAQALAPPPVRCGTCEGANAAGPDRNRMDGRRPAPRAVRTSASGREPARDRSPRFGAWPNARPGVLARPRLTGIASVFPAARSDRPRPNSGALCPLPPVGTLLARANYAGRRSRHPTCSGPSPKACPSATVCPPPPAPFNPRAQPNPEPTPSRARNGGPAAP